MENAAKALIMAGGLLISILVISFMMLVLRKGGQMSSEYDNQIADQELAKFNSQFEVYAKDDNTFFDVMTVANLAWDVNKKNGYDEQNGVTVKIIKENNEQVCYSILPKEALQKNHFFGGGETSAEGIYIYNEGQSNLGGKSIIDYYTARKADNSDYVYKFNCAKIEYHPITGKVKEMHFKIIENK